MNANDIQPVIQIFFQLALLDVLPRISTTSMWREALEHAQLTDRWYRISSMAFPVGRETG